MAFNNEIEKTEGEIKVLQAKLELLKEMENHKSPVEECYKDWWGEYPGNENWTSNATRWQGFQAGYHFAYEEKVVEEPEELKTLYHMKTKAQEVLYAYMDVEKDLSQPKILIYTLKELINQLQVSPGIIKCPDIIELCDELEKL